MAARESLWKSLRYALLPPLFWLDDARNWIVRTFGLSPDGERYGWWRRSRTNARSWPNQAATLHPREGGEIEIAALGDGRFDLSLIAPQGHSTALYLTFDELHSLGVLVFGFTGPK